MTKLQNILTLVSTAIVGAIVAVILTAIYIPRSTTVVPPPAQDQPVHAGAEISGLNYNSATNTKVVCPNGTSTQIVAGSSSRLYFGATVASSTAVNLCKAATCALNTGLQLNGSGGNYEQKATLDNYKGPYSCIGNGASSTLGYTVNQ